jgi:hypothetical protein
MYGTLYILGTPVALYNFAILLSSCVAACTLVQKKITFVSISGHAHFARYTTWQSSSGTTFYPLLTMLPSYCGQ